MSGVHRDLWSEIDRRRDWMIELCRELVRIPTENEPGDTRDCADYIAGRLTAYGLTFETFEPRPTFRSIVSSVRHGDGPHFMLNGHMDVFPADDPSLWDAPPFAGIIEDGKLYGRGVADMKGGFTASLASYLLIKDLGLPLKGRLTFMAVADEETGGTWGTKWLLEKRPDFVPDACVIGEPCAPDAVRVGEKGIAWITLTSRGRSYHGSLADGENCITALAEAIGHVRKIIHETGTAPDDLKSVIDGAKKHYLNDDYKGREHLLEHPSCNVGMIGGGIKANIAPREAVAQVDIRVPFGWTPHKALDWVRNAIAAAGLRDIEATLVDHHSSPNYTSPNSKLAQIVHRNATAVMGAPPTFTITTAATDGRLFRQRGVPTIIYGPRPWHVAGLNEYITLDDLIRVTKVHAATAVDMLGGAS